MQLDRVPVNTATLSIGMYVATSTNEAKVDEIKGWQEEESGTAAKYKV